MVASAPLIGSSPLLSSSSPAALAAGYTTSQAALAASGYTSSQAALAAGYTSSPAALAAAGYTAAGTAAAYSGAGALSGLSSPGLMGGLGGYLASGYPAVSYPSGYATSLADYTGGYPAGAAVKLMQNPALAGSAGGLISNPLNSLNNSMTSQYALAAASPLSLARLHGGSAAMTAGLTVAAGTGRQPRIYKGTESGRVL